MKQNTEFYLLTVEKDGFKIEAYISKKARKCGFYGRL